MPATGANMVTVATIGSDLVVTTDGVAESRPLSAISSLTIIGSDGADDTLSILLEGPLPFATGFDGGAGSDTILGPAADTTWLVDGPGSGWVAGIAFTGVEHLLGAASNEDTFHFAPGGSLAGVVDGGDGGFDTLVLDGAWTTLASAPTDPHSGTLTLDSALVTYAGLEPILVNSGSVANVVFQLTAADDPDVVLTVAAGMLTLSGSTFETTTFSVPSGSLTIVGAGGTDRVTIVGAVALGGASLTISAEHIALAAGASLSTTGNVVLEALATNAGPLIPAVGTLRADVVVEGALTGGAVRISATVEQTVTLTGQALDDTVAFALASAAIAEIRGAAVVTAASLELLATTTIRFSYEGSAATIAAESSSGPGVVQAELDVDVVNTTHAGVTGGARLAVAGAATIAAHDDTDVIVELTDTSAATRLNGTTPDAGFYFSQLRGDVSLVRDTQAYIRDTPGAGQVTQQLGATILRAVDEGRIETTVVSDLVGQVRHAAQDDARASVAGARVNAAGLQLVALTEGEYVATAKDVRNSVAGTTAATVADATLALGSSGLSLIARDASALTATSSDVAAVPLSKRVALSPALSRNDLDPATQASIERSTVTTAGDIAVAAATDAQLLARTRSVAFDEAVPPPPASTAKGVAATLSVNTVTGSVRAFVDASSLSANDVAVSASNGAFVDATSEIAVNSQTIESEEIQPALMRLGASIAVNFIGWDIAIVVLDIDALLLDLVDALLGTDFGATETPLVSEAFLRDTTVVATGSVEVAATSAAQVNATVSNASRVAPADGKFAKSQAADAVLATNKVSSAASAFVLRGSVAATGAVAVAAVDGSGIYANAKLVTVSTTSTDGGVHARGDAIEGLLPADFETNNGTVALAFGSSVRISAGFDNAIYTTSDGAPSLTPGQRVRLDDGYGVARLASSMGKRLLVAGDFVTLAEDWDGSGEAAATYRYRGPNGRVDLELEDYLDAARWAKVGGVAGAVYAFTGPAGAVDLGHEDYSDSSRWALVAGRPGAIYVYLGDDATLDLRAQDYGDLGSWKPYLLTNIVPRGVNQKPAQVVAAGGVVVLNDARTAATAHVTQATVTAASLAVTADGAALIRSIADSSTLATGSDAYNRPGRSQAIGGVIATNRVLGAVRAFVVASTVTTTGDVSVAATNVSIVDADAQSFTTSGGRSAGILLAFNSVGWLPANLLFATLDSIVGDPLLADEEPAETVAWIGDSTIVAGGAVRVSAVSEARIDATAGNDTTSAPTAFLGGGGMAAGGMSAMSASAMVTSNLVSSAVRAFVDDGSVTAGAGIAVLATDAAAISATSDLLATVTSTTDPRVGIVNGWAQAILDDYAFTSNSGSRLVAFGDRIRVADDYDGPDAGSDPDAQAGHVVRFMGTDGVLDLGAQDYANLERFKLLTPTVIITESISYAILSNGGGGGRIAGTGDSYYGLVDRNDVRSSVDAYITDATLRSAGDVVVVALADARLSAADSSAISSWAGYGGMIVTNLVLAHAYAWIDGADVRTTAGASVIVDAQLLSVIDASVTSKIEAFTAISAVAAFNSVGWAAQNVLFNAIEALIGDPVLSDDVFAGEQPAEARAWIADTALLDVDGDLTVSATSSAQITAVMGNENISEAAHDLVFGARVQAMGVAGGVLLASNKVSSAADALLSFAAARGAVDVGGTLTVVAQDSAGIDATATVVQRASVSNTLAGLATIANDILLPGDYDYTTASGTRTLIIGDQVRGGATNPTAAIGAIYRYQGVGGSVNLGTTSFAGGDWNKLTGGADDPEDLYPGIGNLYPSAVRAVGLLIVLNDLRGAVAASVERASIRAAAVDVRALAETQLRAAMENNVAAAGRAYAGPAAVLSVAAQVVTNLVLGSAVATIDDSDVTATGDVAISAALDTAIDATLVSAATSDTEAYGFLLAFNSIGWKPQNVLFNAIDALLGDPLLSAAFDGAQAARTVAAATGSDIAAGGDVALTARGATLLNATVSNAADSVAAALFGATGRAAGAVLASNKVNSDTQAYVSDGAVQAGGNVAVAAGDDSGVYANVKLVTASETTNSGGTGVLQESYNDFVDADFVTSEGSRTLSFGDRVRIADDYAVAALSSDDGAQAVAAGALVSVADDYLATRLTSGAGERLLLTGDKVLVDDDPEYEGGGEPGATYRWIGPTARVALGDEDYADTSRWVKLGGSPGATYRRAGAAGALDLGLQDYGDGAEWTLVAGEPGAVFEWMGADGATVDLDTQDYGDLGYWKPVQHTNLLAQPINVSPSPSLAVGGTVVLNDVRAAVAAYLENVDVTAASISLQADERATIRALADATVTSSGGSTLNGIGTSLAVNAVIATNRVLSSARAYAHASSLTATAGAVAGRRVEHVDRRRDRARVHDDGIGGRRRAARVQLDRLAAGEPLLRDARRDRRRPAPAGGRVRRRAAGRDVGVPQRHARVGRRRRACRRDERRADRLRRGQRGDVGAAGVPRRRRLELQRRRHVESRVELGARVRRVPDGRARRGDGDGRRRRRLRRRPRRDQRVDGHRGRRRAAERPRRRDPQQAHRRRARRLRLHEPLGYARAEARRQGPRRRRPPRRGRRRPGLRLHGHRRAGRPRRAGLRRLRAVEAAHAAEHLQRLGDVRDPVARRHRPRGRRRQLLRADRPQRPAQRRRGLDHRRDRAQLRRRTRRGDRGRAADRRRHEPDRLVERLRRADRHEHRARERARVDRGLRRRHDRHGRPHRRGEPHVDPRRDPPHRDRGVGGRQRGRRVQLDRLDGAEPALQRDRRADRRPGAVGGVRRRAAGRGARVDRRHAARRRRRSRRDGDVRRPAHGDRRQRERRRGAARPRHQRQGAGEGPRRRRHPRVEQGLQRRACLDLVHERPAAASTPAAR